MGKKILVVEDEPDVLKIIDFILKKKGYQVITAVDGQEAIEKAREFLPELIILDFFLPLMSGKEVSEHLKADQALRFIPLLLLTASAENIQEKARECRADDYLLKPFEYLELLGKIEKLLG